jgi:hypothetical protein
MRPILAATAAAALAGCIPDPGPTMAAGQDCMECHGGGGGEGDDARPWTVAGTIAGTRGAHVSITDASGWSFTLRSNSVGNFYTAEGVRFPITVSVDGNPMAGTLPHGSCNAAACHPGGVGGGGGGG